MIKTVTKEWAMSDDRVPTDTDSEEIELEIVALCTQLERGDFHGGDNMISELQDLHVRMQNFWKYTNISSKA